MANFIPIGFETTEPSLWLFWLFGRGRQTRRRSTTRTRWV